MTLESNRDDKGQSHGHPPAIPPATETAAVAAATLFTPAIPLPQTSVEFHEVVKFTK